MSEHSARVLELQLPAQVHQTRVSVVRDTDTVGDALVRMLETRYSQMPVLSEDDRVIGIVTVWSVLRGLVREQDSRQLLRSWVEDHMETPAYVHATATLDHLLDRREDDSALLVGGPENVTGIVTADDLLRYFVDRSKPYVILSEIEEAVRSLIRCCVPDAMLTAALDAALSSKKTGVPARLEDCTFEDYRLIILCRQNRPRFVDALGPTSGAIGSRLAAVRDLRNRVMHFKDPIGPDELALLQDFRTWLTPKVSRARRAAATRDVA